MVHAHNCKCYIYITCFEYWYINMFPRWWQQKYWHYTQLIGLIHRRVRIKLDLHIMTLATPPDHRVNLNAPAEARALTHIYLIPCVCT